MTTDVLFVCVHNAGRSQIAKEIFNSIATQRRLPYRADSAGTQPATSVHGNVAIVLREVGIEISDAKPQFITNEMVEGARKIVTMGCQVDADQCPAIFIKGVEDWGLPDPKGKPMDEVRDIRNTITQKGTELLSSLVTEPNPS